MKSLLKPVLLAGIMLVAAPQAAMAAPAAAPAPASSGTYVPGLAIADIEAVVGNSDASRAAFQQRQVTYKAQIDAYKARSQALQAQLQPLVDKYNRDSQVAKPDQASLQTQAAAIQQGQESAQRELSEMIKPVLFSEAYVNEQIEEKLDQAVKNAMAAKKITLVLKPDVVLATDKTYDLTAGIIAELNKLIPNAQLVPPADWKPRQIREAEAAQQQQAQRAAPPAGAPATSGR
jgi:Skp family chaperone for outer membrane proteins